KCLTYNVTVAADLERGTVNLVHLFHSGHITHTIIMQHWMICVLLLFLAFCDVSTQRKKKTVQTLSRGWGDDITWVQTYEEGLSKAVERSP
ncbi:hypothetical protein cypCar_00049827, partial [Cyprinus carpio]